MNALVFAIIVFAAYISGGIVGYFYGHSNGEEYGRACAKAEREDFMTACQPPEQPPGDLREIRNRRK